LNDVKERSTFQQKTMKVFYKILFWLWLITILVLIYYPRLPKPDIGIKKEMFRPDYIGHLAAYAILMLLYFLWRSDKSYRLPWKHILLAGLAGIVFGVLTEISQIPVPYRTFNPIDIVYNVVGILLGVGIFPLITYFVESLNR